MKSGSQQGLVSSREDSLHASSSLRWWPQAFLILQLPFQSLTLSHTASPHRVSSGSLYPNVPLVSLFRDTSHWIPIHNNLNLITVAKTHFQIRPCSGDLGGHTFWRTLFNSAHDIYQYALSQSCMKLYFSPQKPLELCSPRVSEVKSLSPV